MPTQAQTEVEHAVAAILKHAKALREAGVTRCRIGEQLEVELAHLPPSLEAPIAVTDAAKKAAAEDEQPPSMWNDPVLYGRPPDGKVPGLKKEG